MEVEFNSKDDLENWLRSQGVKEAFAIEAAEILFNGGFVTPDTLAGITPQLLLASGIRVPLAMYLSNKLDKRRQPDEEDLWATSKLLEQYKPALDFARQQLEAKTEHKAMSVASYEFARLLLNGRGINVEVDTPNNEEGSTSDPSPYSWTIETTDNETYKKGEHQGTPDARDWFQQNFASENGEFCLTVVTGEFLPTIRGNQRSTSGKGEVVIGKAAQLKIAVSPFEQAYGLVELKTDEYPIKRAQNVLEIASLATISRLGKSVALLATDCNTKWELCHFKDARTIQRRSYEHGRKCWEDFKELLDNAETRDIEEPPRSPYKQTLPTSFEASDEDEQNLDGFLEGDGREEDSKMKAIERHTMLNNLANYLAEIYGERPSIPEWARAEATCSDYHA